MTYTTSTTSFRALAPWALSTCVLALLSACGGGGGSAGGEGALAPAADVAVVAQDELQSDVATGVTTLEADGDELPPEAALLEAQPAFHAAPLLLQAPDDADAVDPGASATSGPRRQTVPAAFEGLSTRRLTVDMLDNATRARALGVRPAHPEGTATALASGTVVSTYTPAQIRAAYSLPSLPAASVTLTAAQRAQLGAGQTIYIVNAMHNPNVVAELAAFNLKFGLPACTTKAVATNASLPLPAASATACELSVVYTTAAGAMRATAPAYNAGWATEIALDVQWAHATAPLARIVLLEAPDATLASLLAAIKLANSMGPGIVSMSFGAGEGNYTAQGDSAFGGTNMSYLAATGDSGAAVSWPSVSSKVIAVGGTSLSYTGTGQRSEVAWSGTGGGISAYTALPAYQSVAVPGLSGLARRTVADVAFNADPATGQYVAVMTPGSTAVNWISAGGTSLSTPQWAGLMAVANAVRAQTAKPALGAAHAMFYGQIGAVPGTYASAFADILKGSNGSCSVCTARTGYDAVAGLGTPNVGNLLTALAGATATAAAPQVTAATVAGKVGTALSFTVSVAAANPVTYSLSGAPAGMAIGSTGSVNWPAPVAGTYAVTVTAKDSKTGLSGQGVYTVTIAAATPVVVAPVVTGASVSGKPGVALSFTAVVTSPNPVAFSLSGAPAGMAISGTGVVSWAKPLAGSYSVIVVAKDSKTGLSGQGVYTVKIAAGGPVVTTTAMTGVAGKALSGSFSVSSPGASAISVSISGVPLGMWFSLSGLKFTANWPSPVTGKYNLNIRVVDSAGLSATATVPITITAK